MRRKRHSVIQRDSRLTHCSRPPISVKLSCRSPQKSVGGVVIHKQLHKRTTTSTRLLHDAKRREARKMPQVGHFARTPLAHEEVDVLGEVRPVDELLLRDSVGLALRAQPAAAHESARTIGNTPRGCCERCACGLWAGGVGWGAGARRDRTSTAAPDSPARATPCPRQTPPRGATQRWTRSLAGGHRVHPYHRPPRTSHPALVGVERRRTTTPSYTIISGHMFLL